ncbi:hypothetical protein [Nonomuraea sp. NPDC052265]|uniref:hypothetical protein n=1 Tax=Nonomuraea sp. NPDC052265 TaxID=3364374 RepID=UPI0037C93703
MTFTEWRIALATILLFLTVGITWEMRRRAKNAERTTSGHVEEDRPDRLVSPPLLFLLALLMHSSWTSLFIALGLAWAFQAGTRRGRAELAAWYELFTSQRHRGLNLYAVLHPIGGLVYCTLIGSAMLSALYLDFLFGQLTAAI